MSDLQKYWSHNDRMETDLSKLRGIECSNIDAYYLCDDVDARLELMQKQMPEMHDMHAEAAMSEPQTYYVSPSNLFVPDCPDVSYTPVYLAKEIRAMAHDTERLDKLPQCFRAIRESRGKWWLTSAPDRQYDTLREVIDAYQEPGQRMAP